MFVFDGRLAYMLLSVITVFGLGVVISMRCYVCDGAGECCDVGDVGGYFAADAVRDCDVRMMIVVPITVGTPLTTMPLALSSVVADSAWLVLTIAMALSMPMSMMLSTLMVAMLCGVCDVDCGGCDAYDADCDGMADYDAGYECDDDD